MSLVDYGTSHIFVFNSYKTLQIYFIFPLPMIKHIDSYTRIALKDTVHIFTGVLLYSFTGVLFHGQGAETCFFGELWTFSRFRRKIDEVHSSQKLMEHMNLHTAF